jgi:membrane-associated phospholipid phosphatase
LLKERSREVEWILKIQSYRTPWLDRYFSFASTLAEEVSYILLLPGSSWVVSTQLCFHLTVLLAMSVGIGNILKNFFLIPRPPTPPVWVHSQHEMDHGLPSTHTMSAVTIPPFILIYFGYLEPHVPIPPYAFALVLLWSVSIAASRIYNGRHSPMDVIVGAALGLGFLNLFTFHMRPTLDLFITNTSVTGALFVVGVAVSMLVFHPVPPKIPTQAYPETGLVTGTSLGAFLGSWVRQIYTPHSIYAAYHSLFGLPSTYPPTIPFLADHVYLLTALRFVVGVVLVMITRLVVKKAGTMLVVRVAQLFNKDYTPEVGFKHSDGEAAVKLLTYTAIGICVTFTAHIAFVFLGLHLPHDDTFLLRR